MCNNSRGMEQKRKFGASTGWIGYTLAWSNRQFDDLNNGEIFPYRYDRRHDMSVVFSHTFSDKIDAAATWVYGTGSAITLPVLRFSVPPSFQRPWETGNEGYYTDFGGRNSFRLPAYHRMDVGINFRRDRHYRLFGDGKRIINVSAYNSYNRKNAFFVYLGKDAAGRQAYRQASLFPIIPSVSYSFKF